MGELRQLNEQNKLAIWAERVTECRNSGQSVLAWCKEHGICSQTYYKWQKRLFSVGKTAIVNVDPPPSPLQRKLRKKRWAGGADIFLDLNSK